MKITRFLIFLFTLFILSTCKKNSSTPKVGTISATIAGVAQNFNANAQAVLDANQLYGLTIYGQNCDCLQQGALIRIIISSPTPITTGTYVASAFNAVGINTSMTVTEYSPYTVYLYDSKVSASNATVIIKSISATSVQGTFSGTLALNIGIAGAAPTETITNGTFNLNTSSGQ